MTLPTPACARRTAFLLLAALASVFRPALAAAAETGTLSGAVSNTAAGNLLEGARVAAPQLRLATLTDSTGRFVLANVPAGTHEIVVSYLGLDTSRASVTVAAGQRTVQNFDLTSGIYQLDAFKVTGEREGAAAAITAQRNAENLKNIVAMDSYANLSNMNAAEVAIRLPGVAGAYTPDNLIGGFVIRGIGPAMNSVTLDGAPLTSEGALGRNTNINNLSGTTFDQMELIKGHTPDKGADSLAGTINLKSRSPLSLKEKRRLSYSASTRWAPPFFEHIPLREAHRAHPILNLGWQEVFDTFGGERNLGVAVNLFYSEHVIGGFRTIRDFQNTTAQPAFLWDYRNGDNYNNRQLRSLNFKADYRLSPGTKLSFNGIVNDTIESYRRQYETRAFAMQQQIGTTGVATILPGFTSAITRVRATPASTIDNTTTGPGNFFSRMRRFDLGAEHQFGRWQIDYNAVYTQTHVNGAGSGGGGMLVNRITGVGWILDRTASDLHPRFTQTEGPDFTDYRNYRPVTYTKNNSQIDDGSWEGRANMRYELPTRLPIALKLGALWREHEVMTPASDAHRWNFIGTSAIAADPTILPFDTVKTGRRMPQWESEQHFQDFVPANPALWREDLYFHEQMNFTSRRSVTETITAAYLMAQGHIGRTGWLGGVRREQSDTASRGWVRARVPSTPAQQFNDPVGSAQRDYANTFREREGSFTKSFPSLHLTHEVSSHLKARLSWSTSFSRPTLADLLPNETVNEAMRTLTINNAGILPERAQNWDASLEYYFEPVGSLSVGWFHKKVRDLTADSVEIGTVATGNDNGYNGEYAGFQQLTQLNAGTAFGQGWEFSYQQQFTFLPGPLKGLALTANYTVIAAHGDFGSGTGLTTNEIQGFIPRTGNVNLSWRYRKFGARVLYNFTSPYIVMYSAATPGRNVYRYAYDTINAGVSYHWRPTLAFTLDVQNLTNEPERFYRGNVDQMQMTTINGTTMTFGISGRF